MDKEAILNDIFNSDTLGILDVKVKNPLVTTDDRLIASFEEINEFYEKNSCEPKKSADMNERKLFSRLKGLRDNPKKKEALKKYDRYNLLGISKIDSIDDILSSDTFGILDKQDEEDIFTLKNVPKLEKERAKTDFVARRKIFKDFDEYKDMFEQCQKDLKSGKRKLVKFNEKQFEKGAFFVLKGVLVYLEDIINPKKDKNYKLDARTTTIFENGTYSNMLLRSLGKGLYEDGYFVSEHEDRVLDKLSQVSSEDRQNGYIYILKSLSSDDRLVTKKNLYKIGFSTTAVETRIQNAKNDPTYLMADVKVVSVFEVYNINPQKLEQLIHRFFSKSRLDLEIVGNDEKVYHPKEWFIAPLNVIEEAINLMINGRIVDFVYDEENEKIVLKK